MVLPRSSLAGVAIGAVGALVAPTILRPVLVGLVRAGYEIKDYADSAWATAKTEASAIRSEAASSRGSAALEAEIQQLRSEVNALKKKTA